MSDAEQLNTHQKALRVNLDKRWYGSFAEIGAGQEVVRWFFRVGGASGTVAKSMSAYDMAVSDAIYGTAERYVSRPRLQAMLDHEYALNIERLSVMRGDSTSFFAFADTVATRNFQGTNECHGWLGVKFQAQPHDNASQVLVHIRLLDTDNTLVKITLTDLMGGIVGEYGVKGLVQHEIEVNRLEAGAYFLTIETKKGTRVERFLH